MLRWPVRALRWPVPARGGGLKWWSPRSCKTVGSSCLGAKTPHGHGLMGLANVLPTKPRGNPPVHHDALRAGWRRRARSFDARSLHLLGARRRLLARPGPLAAPEDRPGLPARRRPVRRPRGRVHAVPARPRSLRHNRGHARHARRLVVAVRGSLGRRDRQAVGSRDSAGRPGARARAGRAVVEHAAAASGSGGQRRRGRGSARGLRT